MRIQVLSDLHRDVRPAELILSPDADIVVVAGDVCQGVEKALRYVREAVPRPTPVVFVSGNHEHYGHVVATGLSRGHAVAAELGIAFLENEQTFIGGVRFLGCTLWTDYTLYGAERRNEAEFVARCQMNDYRHISTSESRHPWTRFTPSHALALHRISRAWLEEALTQPFVGPTVIVTHHAPSSRSVHPRYAGQALNAAFASDLDDLVEASDAALWIHGHTHSSFDYHVGRTRVVCNPHGYGTENPEYDPGLIVEIGSRPVGALR